MHDAEMALTKDGRILGVKDRFLHDTGAYDPYGLTIPINSQCTLLGPYDIPNYESEFTGRLHQQDRSSRRSAAPAAARRLRERAAARSRRAGAGHRSRRDPPAQPDPAGRGSLTTTRSCSRTSARWSTTAATTRRARQGGGHDRLRERSSARSSRACARPESTSASAWSATSRAPASDRTKARA